MIGSVQYEPWDPMGTRPELGSLFLSHTKSSKTVLHYSCSKPTALCMSNTVPKNPTETGLDDAGPIRCSPKLTGTLPVQTGPGDIDRDGAPQSRSHLRQSNIDRDGAPSHSVPSSGRGWGWSHPVSKSAAHIRRGWVQRHPPPLLRTVMAASPIPAPYRPIP
jgi:hypothetical protein